MLEVKIPHQVNHHLLELTLALYRVTNLFPSTEVLKCQIREKANEIFEDVAECGEDRTFAKDAVRILGKIETIKGYLKIAVAMRFVLPMNLMVLEREYNHIADYFSQELETRSGRDRIRENDTASLQSVEKKKKNVIEPAHLGLSKNEVAVETPRTEIKMNKRQKIIMDHVQKTTSVQLSDLFPVFEDVSQKTIQRDLQELVMRNILKRKGDRRWTMYSLNE